MSFLTDQVQTRRQAAEDYLSQKRVLWDESEKLFHNQLNDSISKNIDSNVFDPKLSNLILSRSYRVMAQLQTGKVKGIDRNDVGDALLKNLLLEKYVIPNANSQFDFLTKMRLVDMYSNVYGNYFSLIDWNIGRNGYIGPDVWLLNIRDVFPQVGAISLDDSDYVIIRTWRPLSYFKGLRKDKGYKNIPEIIKKLEEQSGSKQNRSSENMSKREEVQYPSANPAGKGTGFYEVLTQFERDRWVDYCVDADLEFRDQKNPHEDDDLPVKCKYSIPLIDDFMGYGDLERGASMQMVVNSAWNLYLQGVRMSIFPPVMYNKENIASPSSLKYMPAAKWLMRGNLANAAQPINISPQGISTFNNVYRTASAAILNIFDTTDTTVTQETDPGFGKTPQALNQQQERESTRDNADRYYMETYLKSVMKKFCNLLSKKQAKNIAIRMLPEEIKSLQRTYPDIGQKYNESTGNLSIPKGNKSQLYDYEIVSGSTYAVDQKQAQANLAQLLDMFQRSQTPQGNTLVQTLEQQGYRFNFGELFKRVVSNSGIQDWDKILEEKTEEEMQQEAQEQQIVDQNQLNFQQAVASMQGMNQVPPVPGQQAAGATGPIGI